jgi:hypothetical protein
LSTTACRPEPRLRQQHQPPPDGVAGDLPASASVGTPLTAVAVRTRARAATIFLIFSMTFLLGERGVWALRTIVSTIGLRM